MLIKIEEDRKSDCIWASLLKSDRFSSCHDIQFKIELIDGFILDILKYFNKSSLIQFPNKKKRGTDDKISFSTVFAKLFYLEEIRDIDYYLHSLRSEYNDLLLKTLENLPLDDLLSWNYALNDNLQHSVSSKLKTYCIQVKY